MYDIPVLVIYRISRFNESETLAFIFPSKALTTDTPQMSNHTLRGCQDRIYPNDTAWYNNARFRWYCIVLDFLTIFIVPHVVFLLFFLFASSRLMF